MKKTSPPILHPFLFSAYAVLGVFLSNYKEVPAGQVPRPLAVSILFAIIIYFCILGAKRDKNHAGILTTTLIFAIVFYGHATNFLRQYFPIPSRVNLLIFGFWLFVFFLFSTNWFWRYIRSPQSVTRYLNITSIIVLILPVFVFVKNAVADSRSFKLVHEHSNNLPLISSQVQQDMLPDIYYIILDGYGGNNIHREIYHYDNSDFIKWLQEHNFYVAEQSHTNYIRTLLSLSSSLNMEYLDFLSGKDYVNQAALRELILKSRLEKTLRSSGYKIITFTSVTFFTQLNNADIILSPYSKSVNEFESMLIAHSAFDILVQAFDLDIPGPKYQYQRTVILYDFKELPEVSTFESPKFVFIHVLAPHPPFVFDAEGNYIEPIRPYGIFDANDYQGSPEEYKNGYIQQLQFVNRKVKDVIEKILVNSTKPPVIIIQGDHGPGIYTNFDRLDETCVAERYSILNAYYLPPGAVNPDAFKELNSETSPVNSFRIVLNAYFGTNMEILPNQYYYSSEKTLFAFKELSSQTVQGCQLIPGQ